MSNKKQTAVEWLIEQIENQRETGNTDLRTTLHFCDKAKQMERQQIESTAIKCHFEGVRQKAKTSQEYIEYGEKYYKETYE
jgi:uncharacterized paraquat-inducible protein A